MKEPVLPRLNLPDETGLFCIDGDFTLIDGHTHNRIYGANILSQIIEENGGIEANVDRALAIIDAKTHLGELRPQSMNDWKTLFYILIKNNMSKRLLNKDTREDAQWELVKDMKPVGGDSERWKSLFLRLIEEGHSVAMVSFSLYGKHILPRFLHEVIKLEQDFIAQHICIVSRLPKDQTTKEGHIAEAKEKTGRTNLPPEKIVFCDDDDIVVGNTCRKTKYKPIYANKKGDHIAELFEKCLSVKKPGMDALFVNNSSPCISPRTEDSSINPALAALSDVDSSSTPSPPSKIFSSAASVLRNSPSGAAMRRSATPECGLESSGEYSNDPLRSSLGEVKIN